MMRQLRDSAETARQHLQDALSKKEIDLSRQTGRLTVSKQRRFHVHITVVRKTRLINFLG